MKNERISEIKIALAGLGTEENTLYTNQEIVDKLKELQAAMAKGVFEKTHAKHMKEQDILIHFEALAKEYGLNKSETFLRFKNNMKEFSYTIGTLIKGLNGEQIARRSLKLLSFEENIEILYNVELEDEDAQAEYDAIVIAPYGMFVIEIKNWSASMIISSNGLLQHEGEKGIVYDIPGRMSVKEALLRKHLGKLFPDQYTSMLLIPDEKAKLVDEYKQIPISIGNGISYKIKNYSKDIRSLTEMQISAITNKIRESHKEQRALCSVKCKEIIEDYAMLMAQIESFASSEKTDNNDNSPIIETVQNKEFATCKSFKAHTRSNIKKNAIVFTAFAIPGTIALISILKSNGGKHK